MKTHRYSLAANVFSLSLLVGAAACSSTDNSTDTPGTGGSPNTGGSKATGGSNSPGSGGSSNTGGSGTGGATSSGGSGGSSASGGSTGSGGSASGGDGGSSATGGSTGAGGTAGAPDAGGTETGGGDGPPAAGGAFTLKILGLDESMKFAGGPVFTPAMSKPSQMSPEMTWSGEPAGTKSFAISMLDTGGLSKTPPLKQGPNKKVHFVIFNIPATAHGLPAKIPNMAMLPDPAGTFASLTFEKRFGWFGPGGAPSTYLVSLWALDVDKLPGLDAGANQDTVYKALAAHAIGKPADFLAAGNSGGFK
jgi:phosphatidylethanolamine-binding protein (PEBP) family uncharacterized protein